MRTRSVAALILAGAAGSPLGPDGSSGPTPEQVRAETTIRVLLAVLRAASERRAALDRDGEPAPYVYGGGLYRSGLPTD